MTKPKLGKEYFRQYMRKKREEPGFVQNENEKRQRRFAAKSDIEKDSIRVSTKMRTRQYRLRKKEKAVVYKELCQEAKDVEEASVQNWQQDILD